MEPDASRHIGLIHHVVRQMGLRGDAAEECFSEGLVALTVACQNYNPDKGLPLAHWLARNLRWSLLNWINQQKRQSLSVYPDKKVEPDTAQERLELKEAVLVAHNLLTPQEQLVVLGKAYGYKGIELAKALHCSEGQISKLHQRGVEKLKEALS